MSTEEMLLEVKNLSKQFGGIKAVDNVNLQIRKGEIISVIGPNGAGKTTVFNLLTGIYKPDHGEIYFRGEAIHHLPPIEIVHKGIARTFQNIRLLHEGWEAPEPHRLHRLKASLKERMGRMASRLSWKESHCSKLR